MTKKQQMSLDEAFQRLEEIVSEFEEGEENLEKGMEKFKEGLKISKFLKKRLNKLENEVKEIKESYDLEVEE